MKPSTWTLVTGLIFAAVTVYLIFQFEPVWWSILTPILTAIAAVLAFRRWVIERRTESAAQAAAEDATGDGA